MAQGAGQQVGDGPHLRGERRVTGPAWVEPDVRSPGLQAIGGQQPLHRLGRDRRHDLIAHELPRQFGTVPLAQGSPGLLGQLTRPPHQVQRHLRGKRSVADPTADDPATPQAAHTIPIHPRPHDVRSDADLAGDPIERLPIGRQQDDPRPPHQPRPPPSSAASPLRAPPRASPVNPTTRPLRGPDITPPPPRRLRDHTAAQRCFVNR